MSNLKKGQFHIPFIKSLVLMGLVTIVSMISVHYFILQSFSTPSNTRVYTSSESQFQSK